MKNSQKHVNTNLTTPAYHIFCFFTLHYENVSVFKSGLHGGAIVHSFHGHTIFLLTFLYRWTLKQVLLYCSSKERHTQSNSVDLNAGIFLEIVTILLNSMTF